jgi:hypothetical protein
MRGRDQAGPPLDLRAYALPLVQNTIAAKDFFEKIGV